MGQATCVPTFHVGLDLPDELIGLGAVKEGPDGRKGVQDNGLRVRIDVLLKGKHTSSGWRLEAELETSFPQHSIRHALMASIPLLLPPSAPQP